MFKAWQQIHCSSQSLLSILIADAKANAQSAQDSLGRGTKDEIVTAAEWCSRCVNHLAIAGDQHSRIQAVRNLEHQSECPLSTDDNEHSDHVPSDRSAGSVLRWHLLGEDVVAAVCAALWDLWLGAYLCRYSGALCGFITHVLVCWILFLVSSVETHHSAGSPLARHTVHVLQRLLQGPHGQHVQSRHLIVFSEVIYHVCILSHVYSWLVSRTHDPAAAVDVVVCRCRKWMILPPYPWPVPAR